MTDRIRRIIVLAALMLLSGCGLQRFFYYPNRNLYQDPANAGLPYDILNYPSLNGKTLYAVYFRTDQPPKGTIVHFHGNFGNVSNHFPLALFLLRQGFDVIAFDYQGYGASEGRPTPTTTVEDGIATVRYAQAHLRNPKTGVGVFGQSLGGSIAIVVAAKEPLVKAAVIEAAFATYPGMARAAMQRHILTWLLVPVTFLVSDTNDPIDSIGQISPRPLLLIHGTDDKIVPFEMSEKLFAKAKEPKTFWNVEGAGHLQCRTVAGQEYDGTIGAFFTKAITSNAGS